MTIAAGSKASAADILKTLTASGYLISGAHADRPASPVVGQIYTETDTNKLCFCAVAGTWIELVAAPSAWTAEEDATPVYASASSITFAGVDVTARYEPGVKIRFKQGGSYKYFYVVSSSFSTDTTVNVTGGSDYTVANAAITDFYYSHSEIAEGFPTWFAYAPTHTGFSADPTVIARFSMRGRMVTVVYRCSASGTSNQTYYTITAPITSKTLTNMIWFAWIRATDNTSTVTDGRAGIGSATTTINLYTSAAGGAWTASGGKGADFILVYEI